MDGIKICGLVFKIRKMKLDERGFMKFSGLVIGDEIYKCMNPFSEHRKIEPYKKVLSAEETKEIFEEYGIASEINEVALGKAKEYHKKDGGIENGQIYLWQDTPEDWNFDHCGLSSKPELFLKYLEPKKKKKYLILTEIQTETNSALVSEINLGEVNIEALTFIVVDGAWHCTEPWAGNSIDNSPEWALKAKKILSGLAPNRKINVVDCHW